MQRPQRIGIPRKSEETGCPDAGPSTRSQAKREREGNWWAQKLTLPGTLINNLRAKQEQRHQARGQTRMAGDATCRALQVQHARCTRTCTSRLPSFAPHCHLSLRFVTRSPAIQPGNTACRHLPPLFFQATSPPSSLTHTSPTKSGASSKTARNERSCREDHYRGFCQPRRVRV